MRKQYINPTTRDPEGDVFVCVNSINPTTRDPEGDVFVCVNSINTTTVPEKLRAGDRSTYIDVYKSMYFVDRASKSVFSCD